MYKIEDFLLSVASFLGLDILSIVPPVLWEMSTFDMTLNHFFYFIKSSKTF